MIKTDIYLPEYDWEVRFYFSVSSYFLTEICSDLRSLGCDDCEVLSAYKDMYYDRLNRGLCYANISQRRAVVVVGKASSAKEFTNSFVHEIAHLAVYIGEEVGIEPSGEEHCYLQGDIAEAVFPLCSGLFVDETIDNRTENRYYSD